MTRVYTKTIRETAEVAEDGRAGVGASAGQSAPRNSSLVGSLMTAVGGLGFALAIERGGSFLSNVLAARLGGAKNFGSYSVALMAANNVAWYAGSGIGTTSARLTAEHAPGAEGYCRIIRSLGIIGLISAAIAAVALWLGAAPMARTLLHNEFLVTPLRAAALSAAAFVLVECCRGVFIGTRNFAYVLVLSVLIGVGLLAMVPRAARFGPTRMINGQSAALFLAIGVATILILWRPKARPARDVREIEPASLGRIWRFGLMQLGGVVGMNAAGWWTASLVARMDASLIQVAFYTAATQLRNFSSLVPSLVQQGNLALFTDEGARDFGGAKRVIQVSSITASALSTICAGLVVLVLPWTLRHTYGADFTKAELPAVLAVATLLVHFGVSPAASRLVFVSLFWSGVVNAVWAVFVVIAGTMLVPLAGATAATAVLFLAHVISMFLNVACLKRLDALPPSVTMLAVLDTLTALAICALACFRHMVPHYSLVFSFLLLAVTVGVASLLLRYGQNCGAFPTPLRVASLLHSWRGQSAIR